MLISVVSIFSSSYFLNTWSNMEFGEWWRSTWALAILIVVLHVCFDYIVSKGGCPLY